MIMFSAEKHLLIKPKLRKQKDYRSIKWLWFYIGWMPYDKASKMVCDEVNIRVEFHSTDNV